MAVEHGYMPLGKYSSARDDILHFMCTSDWANESSGNSEAPSGYFWKISNTPEEVQQGNTETDSLLEEWFQQSPEVIDSPELRAELVGHFIVATDSQGFVSVARYTIPLQQETAYESLEEIYSEWEDQEGEAWS